MRRALVVSLIVAGAGCGTDATPTIDGGVTPGVDLTMITPTVDLAMPKPDMSVPPPTGMKLVSGAHFLYGITPDNFAVGINLNNNNALSAVPVGGGNEQTISPGGWTMMIHKSAVFDWEAVDQATNVGQANVWRSATGTKAMPNGDLAVAGLGDCTADGAYVYYSGGSAVDGSSTDLYVAKSDGTGSMKVATGGKVDTTGDTSVCSTHAAFDAKNNLIAIVCGKGDNGGDALVAIDPATGKSTKLAGNVGIWFVTDPNGKYVLANDNSGKLSLYPIDGSAAIAVDKDVTDNQAIFLQDGSAVLYITTGGALKRATVGMAPAPVTLVAANVAIFRRFNISREIKPALSPDDKFVIISNQYDDTTGIGDIFMASTSTPGMPTTLVADSSGEIFGDAFTMDSKFVLYYTKTAQIGSGLVGTFNAKPVAGGNAVEIGQKVWVSYNGTGSISGFNDNYKSGKGGIGDYGTADLKIVDVASPANVKVVALKGDAEFWPTADRKIFVFTSRVAPSTSGVYTIPAAVN